MEHAPLRVSLFEGTSSLCGLKETRFAPSWGVPPRDARMGVAQSCRSLKVGGFLLVLFSKPSERGRIHFLRSPHAPGLEVGAATSRTKASGRSSGRRTCSGAWWR